MSSPLALAAVTATLCDLLNNGLIDNDLSPVGSFSVTAVPPDRIETGEQELNRLNLFLYQVTPNLGWRNEGMAARDSRDSRIRLSNPPLALDLHYMLTAYGSAPWAAEILLGFAMDVLHEKCVLSRADIRRALDPANNPISVALVPPDPQGRIALDLADQVEHLKILPQYLTSEELARLWTSMQARYRPTMAYEVCTVLIQSKRATQAALPVLKRGQQDRGVNSQADTHAPAPSVPTLTAMSIVPTPSTDDRAAAEQGDALDIDGVLLAGDTVTAELRHARLEEPNILPVEAGVTAGRVRIVLPQSHDSTLPGFDAHASVDWPAGTYTVSLRIERAGKPDRFTNALPLTLAPRLTAAPVIVTAMGGPQLILHFHPEAWPEQRIEVFVGGDVFGPIKINDKAATLGMSIKGFTPAEGKVPVRLRVDGIETQIVRNRAAEPPEFDMQQTVSLPT